MVSDFAQLMTTPYGNVIIVVFGLLAGSFLNVVITRLPMMIERTERRLSLQQLAIEPPPAATLNLAWPGSFCLSCRSPIRWYHNVPLVSWMLLRGHCASCGSPISPRFPLVEALTATLFLTLFTCYGASVEFCFKAFFCMTLLAVAYIDWETGLLPDAATVPLIGGGLLYSTFTLFDANGVTPSDAIIGAVVGYGLFWTLNFAYRSLTGRDGIGYGDFKLVAALGAWFGWILLPLALLLAAMFAFVFGLIGLLRGTYQRDLGIRFAPFISVVGVGLLLARDLGVLPAYLAN